MVENITPQLKVQNYHLHWSRYHCKLAPQYVPDLAIAQHVHHLEACGHGVPAAWLSPLSGRGACPSLPSAPRKTPDRWGTCTPPPVGQLSTWSLFIKDQPHHLDRLEVVVGEVRSSSQGAPGVVFWVHWLFHLEQFLMRLEVRENTTKLGTNWNKKEQWMNRYQHKKTHHNDNIFPNFPCFQLVYELCLPFGFKSRFGTFAMEPCLRLDLWWQKQRQWHFEERKQGLAPSQTCISSDWRTDAPNHSQQLKRNWNAASHYNIVDHLCEFLQFFWWIFDVRLITWAILCWWI